MQLLGPGWPCGPAWGPPWLPPACSPHPTYPLILFGVLPSLSATWGTFLRAVQAGPAPALAWLSSWDAGPPGGENVCIFPGPASAVVLSLVLLRARPLPSFLLAPPPGPQQSVTWDSSGPGSSVGMVWQPEGARWVAQGWLSPGALGSRGPGFGRPSGGCGWPSSREQQAAAGSRSGWSEPSRAGPVSGCCRCRGHLGGGRARPWGHSLPRLCVRRALPTQSPPR